MMGIDDMLNCKGEVGTQLVLLCLYAMLCFLILPMLTETIIKPYISKQSWKKNWTILSRNMLAKSAAVYFETEEDAYHFAASLGSVTFQHFIGGTLCIPSQMPWLFPGFSKQLRSTLVGHGALIESGWELQDLIVRFYQLMFLGEAGRRMNPVPLVVIMVVHHAMGLTMAIPMNMYYRDSPLYHEVSVHSIYTYLFLHASFMSSSHHH